MNMDEFRQDQDGVSWTLLQNHIKIKAKMESKPQRVSEGGISPTLPPHPPPPPQLESPACCMVGHLTSTAPKAEEKVLGHPVASSLQASQSHQVAPDHLLGKK